MTCWWAWYRGEKNVGIRTFQVCVVMFWMRLLLLQYSNHSLYSHSRQCPSESSQ